MQKHKNPQDLRQPTTSNKETNDSISILNWRPEEQAPTLIDPSKPINLSKHIIHNKYFEAFNFYFSKHINEIIADVNLPHVILYKDYLYYDDVDEFLKRYYTHEEAIPRIDNLSKFYMTMHENINKPNLAIHEQNDIILKRNNRHHKLFLAKLNNFDGLPQTHRLPNQALEDSEDYTDSNEDSSDSESSGQKKILGNILGGEEERVHNSFQRELDQYPDYEIISYESNQHDMYNPKSSCSESSQGSGSMPVLPPPASNIIRSRLAQHPNLENRGGAAVPVEPKELDQSLSVIIKHEEKGTKDSVFDIYEMDHIEDDDASNLSLTEISEVNVAERLVTGADESSGVRSPRDFIKYNWRQNVDDELEKLIDERLVMESMKTASVSAQKHVMLTESTPMSTAGMEGESQSQSGGVSQKTIPKLKKPLVPKMNITNSGSGRSTDKKPRKTTESEEKERYNKLDNQKTIKTATSQWNSVRVASEEDNKRRVQTEEQQYVLNSASAHRNNQLKGEVPKSLYASSSTTRLLPKPQMHPQMSDRKILTKVPQRIPAQKNNENKIPPPPQYTEEFAPTPQKKTVNKAIPQMIAKNNLGINLQSCYSKDKGTCLEQLTALQAPKHSDYTTRIVGKLSIPKLTTSPRSPIKSKSQKILKPRTDSKEDLLRHHKTEEKEINVTERLKTIKKIFDKTAHYQQANTTGKKYHIGAGLGRSKTEEALLTNISERSLRTDTKAPLSKTQRQKIDSSLKALTSFGKTKNKEMTSSHKSLAKEPSIRDFISLANMRQLQNSSDISKSLREFHPIHDEKQFYSSQKVSKNKSAKSLHKQIKTKGKASIKTSKSKPLSKETFDYNSVATRRTTAGPHTTIPSFSVAKGHNLGSLPISPEKRTLNVNVSLKQLGSHGHKSVNDHTMDNSYGFWTSRSSKGNVDDPVNNLATATKGLAKTSSSKFVLHTEGDHSGEKNPAEKRYHTDHNVTKPKVSKTRKATKVSMFQQFKETENEMLRNIKHLKPNYMLQAWPRGNNNKSLEEKEATTMVNGSHTTMGYVSHIVPSQKTVKKIVKKGKKKAVEGAK